MLFLELGRGFEFSQRSYPSSLWDTGVSRALPGPHNFVKWEIPHKLNFQNLFFFFFLIRELGNTEQAVSSCWQFGGAEWWQLCSLKGMPGEPATGLPSLRLVPRTLVFRLVSVDLWVWELWSWSTNPHRPCPMHLPVHVSAAPGGQKFYIIYGRVPRAKHNPCTQRAGAHQIFVE